MTAITDLDTLLAELAPCLEEGEYAFVSVAGPEAVPADLEPLATVREAEGLSLVVLTEAAARVGLRGVGPYRLISLRVRSSLDAVGLTAATTRALALQGISANVIAGYHHDYILVPARRGRDALATLRSLVRDARRDGRD